MHEAPPHHTWQRGEYEISTDPARVDLDLTHRFLSEEAYWSPGVPRDIVERAIGNSIVFGLYKGGAHRLNTSIVFTSRVAP